MTRHEDPTIRQRPATQICGLVPVPWYDRMVGFSVVGQYLCPLQPDPCLMETTIILWNICSCKRIKDSTTETRGTGLGTTLNADKRIDGIDFWRGVALLTIFIDHAPDNVFQKITVGNFGFSDAADLFVFLSGASVALAYGSRFSAARQPPRSGQYSAARSRSTGCRFSF